jgi:hypothetical protein
LAALGDAPHVVNVGAGTAMVDGAVARLRDDLRAGAWHDRNRDILTLDEIDLGYRLLTGPAPRIRMRLGDQFLQRMSNWQFTLTRPVSSS